MEAENPDFVAKIEKMYGTAFGEVHSYALTRPENYPRDLTGSEELAKLVANLGLKSDLVVGGMGYPRRRGLHNTWFDIITQALNERMVSHAGGAVSFSRGFLEERGNTGVEVHKFFREDWWEARLIQIDMISDGDKYRVFLQNFEAWENLKNFNLRKGLKAIRRAVAMLVIPEIVIKQFKEEGRGVIILDGINGQQEVTAIRVRYLGDSLFEAVYEQSFPAGGLWIEDNFKGPKYIIAQVKPKEVEGE